MQKLRQNQAMLAQFGLVDLNKKEEAQSKRRTPRAKNKNRVEPVGLETPSDVPVRRYE
jgi:hypothetical protein